MLGIGEEGREMLFSKGFRGGMVVSDEDERAVSKSTSRETVMNCYNIAVDEAFPVFDGADSLLAREPETCRWELVSKRR